MRPDRIALFGYAHVPWMAKKQRLIDDAALPGAMQRIEQAGESSQALVDAGYIAIGLDHFALPHDPMAIVAGKGLLRRNFQGYTTDQADTLLGLGATSIGRTPFGYVQNISETGAWTRSIESGVLPTARGYALEGEDQLRAHVIEQLMCQGRVDLAAVACRYDAPVDWYADVTPCLLDLQSEGIVALDGSLLVIREAGKPLMRVVASLFDAFLAANVARHAVAV